MHLPDGFINNQISIGLIAVAAGFIVSSFVKLRRIVTKKLTVVKAGLALADGLTSESSLSQRTVLTKKGSEKVQQMAMIGALIFAMQMINFPVTNGTSGHLIGGVLAAIVLGPWAGVIVISSVLIIQSLIFADGGLMALGANIFNMGLIACVGCYYYYQFLKKLKVPKLVALGVTAWLSVISASFFCALEIGLSKTISLDLVIPAMVKIHLLIGIGEVIITILVIKLLKLKSYED